eukprot:3092850-Amphidinium_carterae.1
MVGLIPPRVEQELRCVPSSFPSPGRKPAFCVATYSPGGNSEEFLPVRLGKFPVLLTFTSSLAKVGQIMQETFSRAHGERLLATEPRMLHHLKKYLLDRAHKES